MNKLRAILKWIEFKGYFVEEAFQGTGDEVFFKMNCYMQPKEVDTLEKHFMVDFYHLCGDSDWKDTAKREWVRSKQWLKYDVDREEWMEVEKSEMYTKLYRY
jgi:hypothetical protein